MIEFIKKISGKERMGLFIALAFVLVVLTDRLVVSPIAGTFSRLDRESKMAVRQLSALLRNMEQKDTVSVEYQKYIQHIKKAPSDEEDIARMLGEIEGLARMSSLSVSDMKPQPSRTIGSYRQYSVEVEAEGTEESIVKFLHNLNNSLQLLRAEKVRISLKEKSSADIKMSVLVTKLVTS
ncbi:MAG: type 4a pilus biogenesis protein PilO [Candidatus Omnitrophota bacterium]|nr:type 4a pilus biogenesis protein PilO [Candidatus Omnitrophota bacterium]